MKRSFWRRLTMILTIILLSRCMWARSHPYTFSSEAIESVPNIAQRANSPDLNDRIGVLDQLMPEDALSDVFRYRYAYDLPPKDYLAVASSLLEGGLFQIKDTEKVRGVFGRVTQAAIRFRLSELLAQMVVALKSNDPIVQVQALTVFSQLGGKKYTKELIDVASSSNRGVRRRALEILLKSDDREAIPVFISCLTDNDFAIR